MIAFICGCGHTGSTLLARILGSHTRVYCPEYETNAFLTVEGVESIPALLEVAEGRYLIEKTPRHIHMLDLIRRCFPAKFVLTVRDGRNVAASFVRRCGDPCVNRWIEDTGIVMKEATSPDVTFCRYEDLIADSEAEIAKICAFLGLEYEPEMLLYHAKPVNWYGVEPDPEGTHEQRRAWQVNQPIFDGRGEQVDAPELEFGKGLEIMRFFGYTE